MKHFYPKNILLCLCLFIGTKTFAYDAKIDGIYYNFSGDEATVTFQKNQNSTYTSDYSGAVVIPQLVTYKGKNFSVTSIGKNAFQYCSSLTSVTIPNSVTSIGQQAFYYCKGLTSVTIPGSVTSIGSTAFFCCSSLTSVTIPNSVTSIGSSAFYDCSSLTSVTIGNSVTSIGNSAFSGCIGLTSVTIPNSVTSIGDWAFSHCIGLTSVTIPNSVTSIGEYAFYECSGLTSVTIPNSVTSIGNSAFYGCGSLSSITIPNSVTSIGRLSFSGCSGLTTVTLGSNAIVSATRTSNTSLKSIFGNQVEKYVLNHSVKSIGEYAFYGCSGLISINITESVTNIGDYAFEGCSNMTSITIPDGVMGIGSNAIPEAVTIYTSVGKSLLALWNAGYENILENGSGKVLGKPNISLLKASPSSLSFTANNLYTAFHDTMTFSYYGKDKRIIISEELNSENNEITYRGLQPNCLHSITITSSIEDTSHTMYFSVNTNPLTFVTQQPKIISVGNVIVAAQSNLNDEETNVGFEWRRTDWTSDFASNYAVGYLYNGAMEGYIRNINAEKLWKYRPYYEANSGNRYYGDWVGIDPTNTSYFEPTVHTYSNINVQGNTAEVRGYAMRGTDNVTSQGFMYWPTNTSSPRRKANGIPSDAVTVLASGNVMTATLENLEYETTYCYVAFVTTSEGETFYGEQQMFTTGERDPDGIEEIRDEGLRIKNEGAWYSIDGRKLDKPQKGINIIRYSDGTSRKVVVK